MAKLTERQQDHLRYLADGRRHRPIKGVSNASVYMTLINKGLARACYLQSILGYEITDAGRAALQEAGR